MRVRAKVMCFIGGARRRPGEEFDILGKKCPACCEPAKTKKKENKPDKQPETLTDLGDGIR